MRAKIKRWNSLVAHSSAADRLRSAALWRTANSITHYV